MDATALKQSILACLETETDHITGEIPRYRIDVLLQSLFKKLKTTSSESSRLHEEAVAKFHATMARLDKLDVPDSDLIGYMRDELAYIFQDMTISFSLNSLLEVGKCGPGVSNGAKETPYYYKMFSSSLTHTDPTLFNFYKRWLTGRWIPAEIFRSEHHPSRTIEGSKFATVDKDETSRRAICTEPTLNMFFQLGAKHKINEILAKYHNINVENQQEVNRKLAKLGSIRGNLSTIDLSEASDSISTKLVQALLPTRIFSILDQIRSKKIKVSGEYESYPLFCTMGNGFTFSLMTLILSTLVRSVYRINGIHPRNGKNYAVFGDDIICTTDLFPKVIDALRSIGFLPNERKTFSEGHFRESCGSDYFKGFYVRGIYAKKLESQSDFYSLYNRLLRWSLLSGIDIPHTLATVLEQIDSYRFVPRHSGAESGIICPSSRVWFYPRDHNGAIRFRHLKAHATRIRVKDNPYLNYDGAVICTILGSIRGSCMTIRSQSDRYKVAKEVSPHWDFEAIHSEDTEYKTGIYFLTRSAFAEEADRLIRHSFECLTLRRLEGL